MIDGETYILGKPSDKRIDLDGDTFIPGVSDNICRMAAWSEDPMCLAQREPYIQEIAAKHLGHTSLVAIVDAGGNLVDSRCQRGRLGVTALVRPVGPSFGVRR